MYECKSIELVTSFYTSPGFADEIVHVYVATGLTKKENALALDEDEFVNLLEWSLEEAQDAIETKQIYDAKTVFALQYLQLQEAIKQK